MNNVVLKVRRSPAACGLLAFLAIREFYVSNALVYDFLSISFHIFYEVIYILCDMEMATDSAVNHCSMTIYVDSFHFVKAMVCRTIIRNAVLGKQW